MGKVEDDFLKIWSNTFKTNKTYLINDKTGLCNNDT